jgi:hypothetical protein
MNKRYLHHLWTRIRPVSYWYFLVAAAVCFMVFLYAYRQNNLTMIQLRENVFTADKADGDVETALRELREYVYGHMHTELSSGDNPIKPPIQLKYRYERLAAAEKAKTDSGNKDLYATAESICEAKFPAGQLANGRVQCVQEYVSSHAMSTQAVPEGLYKFDFVSPRWSPDLAGWSLVFTIALTFLALVRVLLEFWFRSQLHRHE